MKNTRNDICQVAMFNLETGKSKKTNYYSCYWCGEVGDKISIWNHRHSIIRHFWTWLLNKLYGADGGGLI